MVHYLRGKGLDHGVEPSIVKYVKYTPPPPRIMKVKRKKYEPLEVVFKDKARKIGDISTKAEKKDTIYKAKGITMQYFSRNLCRYKEFKNYQKFGDYAM